MPAISDRALAVGRPVTMSWECMWMPLFGVLWVVINVSLVALGIRIGWPFVCAFVAGLINGSLLSVIALTAASARIQASATGLLGGLTLSGLRNDGSMIAKAIQSLHGLADSVLQALGIESSEPLHRAIEQEAIYMVWTMLFVVLASLVAEWVRSVQSQG
jgi:hypothetical protein